MPNACETGRKRMVKARGYPPIPSFLKQLRSPITRYHSINLSRMWMGLR